MSRQVLIDAWGRPSYNPHYKDSAVKPTAYQVDAATSGTTYIRFSDSPKNAIQKIVDADGVTTITVAFGAWADRATLDYHPVNKPTLIDIDDLENIWTKN